MDDSVYEARLRKLFDQIGSRMDSLRNINTELTRKLERIDLASQRVDWVKILSLAAHVLEPNEFDPLADFVERLDLEFP